MKIEIPPARGIRRWLVCAATTIRCELLDQLRAIVRRPAGALLLAASKSVPGYRNRILLALAAARYWPCAVTYRHLAGFGESLFASCSDIVMKKGEPLSELALKRVLVLKMHQVRDGRIERGAVLVKFTPSFGALYAALRGTRFFEYYRVILEPSWSGYALPEILCWFDAGTADAVVVQAFDPRDRALLSELGLSDHAVSVGPGSWADYRKFEPAPDAVGSRRYAVIYVANYTWMKRLHVYLRLVRRLARHGHRCALVCGSFGGERETVVRMAQFYGVERSLDFFEDISHDEVVEMLNLSEVSVLLSRKEGMNRGVSESIFCDVPVVVLQENVGNHSCITHATGLIAPERRLHHAVRDILAQRERLAPRRWALSHITPERSTAVVEAALRERAMAAGERWTSGIAVKVNSPEAMLFDPASTLPKFADLIGTANGRTVRRAGDSVAPSFVDVLAVRAPMQSGINHGG